MDIMFTEPGDKAINLVLSQYTKRATPIKKSEVEDIITQICEQVKEMGKGQTNPSKYDGAPIEGFREVTDTSVRETLYLSLMSQAIEG